MLAGGVPDEKLVPLYFERHHVRPGITGLAQACGLRGDTRDPRSALERVHYDLAYVRNGSITLDLKILWCTLRNECLKCTGM
jgi:lipopolysaccharide/colanic/teichoic acid biosynthesis glycosyltransferase